MRRKMVALTLAVSMICSLMGCGGKQEAATEEVTTTQATTEEATIQENTTEEEEKDEIALNVNLIENGDFSNGTDGFNTYCNGGAVDMKTDEQEQLVCDIAKTGSVEHGVQVYYDGFAMQQGVEYEFSFDVYSTMEREIEWRVQINGDDYHAYASNRIAVTTEPQHVTERFTMEESSDPAPRLCFNMGYMESMKDAGSDPEAVGEHSIFLDNISLMAVNADGAVTDEAGVEVPKVKIDQIGYGKKDTKIAVFSDLDENDTTFAVVEADTGKEVWKGDISDRVKNTPAGEENATGDFSDFKDEGTYQIVTGMGEVSDIFVIGEDVYQDAFSDIVKMFYLQRCGQELEETYAGEFAHPVCHHTDAVIYGTDQKMDVSGGWHDAGDYGRYVVSGAKAAADLMLAYQKNPELFSDDMGIPESGNGVSDLLDEVRYELEWMLKMQDSESGGVYHKVTCKVFPETVMPQDETDELVISPISNTATGDFAAVMAMASMVYADVDAEFADRCIQQAEKAWLYVEANADADGFQNPKDVVTGEYPDDTCTDEMFWAAAELCKATDDVTYLEFAKDLYTKVKNFNGLGWADVAAYGAYAALTSEALALDSSNFAMDLKNTFITEADKAIRIAKDNPYMVRKARSYEWGSNMGIANTGMLLCLADEIQQNDEYEAYADSHLHYLFGVNATGYCFVTGYGTLSPKQPHHRPSQVVGSAMTGMLVGGPDSALEDPYAKAVFTDTPAAKCYVDNVQSYSCNEVTIYWNSPLVYLFAATRHK